MGSVSINTAFPLTMAAPEYVTNVIICLQQAIMRYGHDTVSIRSSQHPLTITREGLDFRKRLGGTLFNYYTRVSQHIDHKWK
jgi:hypothetical protein